MNIRKGLACALVALTAFGATGATASAAQMEGRGDCWVWAGTPGRAYWAPSKKNYAYAHIWVWCNTNRTVIVNAQLMEDDVTSDDEMGDIGSFGETVVTARRWNYVGHIWAWCQDQDPTGKEEIYSRAKVNVVGLNSRWARSPNLSTDC